MNEDGVKKLFDRADVLENADLRNLTKHLWKQREFFKKMFDIIKDSIVVIDARGRIFYCNASARQMLGISDLRQANILWKYIPEFITFANFDLDSMANGDSFLSKEVKISYPRKSILNITITHNINDDVDGEKTFVLRIVDVTEERQLNEKTINNEKISSIMLLASSVAHEIGNPLNAIALRLQLMQRQFKAIKDTSERNKLEVSAQVCLDEISRLDGIIKNFLHAIRPQKPNLQDVRLNDLLNKSLSLMDAEFKSLNVKIVRNIEELPIVLGDVDQLKQVFFNVLKNACEAIAGEGTIFIEGYSNDNDVILSFTDNGVGIPCEIVDKIFQPYFSTKGGGNGLGMMIVERILREHGATIDISSAKNVGTKLSINFPRKDKKVPLLD